MSTFPRSGKFSKKIIRAAWKRQGGRCAICGDKLVEVYKDEGEAGAWHAHPRFLGLGYGSEDNCVLLCTNLPKSCHWNVGHASFHQKFYAPLEDLDLPYLNAGTDPNSPAANSR